MSKNPMPKPSYEQIRMPRWRVSIPGWKELLIEGFFVEPTYLNVLEGTTKGINGLIIEDLPERARSIFYPKSSKSAHFAKPTREQMKRPFPDFLCMAAVTDAPVQDDTLTDDTLYSRVVCCWFTNDLNCSIEALILDGIQPFAWDDYAENCEL